MENLPAGQKETRRDADVHYRAILDVKLYTTTTVPSERVKESDWTTNKYTICDAMVLYGTL